MAPYHVRFIHKISPRDTDTASADLPDSAFSDRKTLGAALRKAQILPGGTRLFSYRTEGDKVIAFPCGSIWHSIILTHEGN
jgi:hypothetical protein